MCSCYKFLKQYGAKSVSTWKFYRELEEGGTLQCNECGINMSGYEGCFECLNENHENDRKQVVKDELLNQLSDKKETETAEEINIKGRDYYFNFHGYYNYWQSAPVAIRNRTDKRRFICFGCTTIILRMIHKSKTDQNNNNKNNNNIIESDDNNNNTINQKQNAPNVVNDKSKSIEQKPSV